VPSLTGGSVEIFGATGSLTQCHFHDNVAQSGGALRIEGATAPVVVTDCVFEHNSTTTGFGGAATIDQSKVDFVGCSFIDNESADHGGAVYCKSSVAQFFDVSFDVCGFTGNLAGASGTGDGGAIAVWMINPTTSYGVSIIGSFFEANVATGRGGAVQIIDGRLVIEGSEFVGNLATEANGIDVRGGQIQGYGDFLDGDDLFCSGILAPGDVAEAKIGQLPLMGGLTLHTEGGTPEARFEIGGTRRGEFDTVGSSKAPAELAGTLVADFVGGFQPQAGDSFRVIPASDLTGVFSATLSHHVPPGILLDLAYDPDGVRVTASTAESVIEFLETETDEIPGTPLAAAASDLDNDGDPDVVVAIPGATGSSNGKLIIFRNNGNDANGAWLGFTSNIAQPTLGINPNDIVIANLDADAFVDIAVTSGANKRVTVLINNANGLATFKAPVHITLTDAPTSIASADADLDGDRDLLVATPTANALQRLLNNGSGTFSVGSLVPTAVSPKAVVAADTDDDGAVELLVVCAGQFPSDAVLAVHTVSGGEIGAPQSYSIAADPLDLAVGDLNADGLHDVIAVSTATNALSILLHHPTNPDFDAMSKLAISGPFSPMVFDIEPDEDQDLALVSSEDGVPTVKVLRNDSGTSLNFSSIQGLATPGSTKVVLGADVNLDDLVDLVTINASVVAGVAAGPGIVGLLNATEPTQIFGDLNGDFTVDGADLGLLLSEWGTCANCDGDLNGDGAIDGADLGLLLAAWS
jgi:predicted outer membrane repeat protein